MEYDLVICGAGTAGLACAIAAVEAGARVVVLEKDAEIGGTLHLSAGQMSAAGSRLQRSKGIEDSPDLHFADVMRIGHGRNDPVIVRLAVDEAARTIDWLEELGFPFPEEMPIIYHGHDAYERPRTYWGPEMGVSILNTIRPRFEELVAGGAVKLLLEHPFHELIVEGDAVRGVRATGPDGEIEVRGGATILATGGYAGSPERFAELHPGLHTVLGARFTSTGDGLVAARRIGAAIRGAENHVPMFAAIETAPGSGRCDIWDAQATLNPHYRQPREIYVNAAGERFIREDSPERDPCEHALLEQGGRFWIVFDEAALDDDESPLVVGWSDEMLRAKAAAGENVWTADDVGDLARLAGVDAGGLVRTVAAFNDAVRAGSDPLGREHLENEIARPPFYAVLAQSGAVTGFAGLHVDGELRVLDTGGAPIAGLYAAGEVIGGGATMGDAFCSGMMVTPAMSLGRLLGRKLAAALPAEAAAAG